MPEHFRGAAVPPQGAKTKRAVDDGYVYFNSEAVSSASFDAIALGLFAHLVFLGRTVHATVQDLAAEADLKPRVIAAGLQKLAAAGWIIIDGSGPARTIEVNQGIVICSGHWEGGGVRASSFRRTANLWDPKRRSVNASVRRRILAKHGARCCYCGSHDGPWHIDHRMPASRGGGDEDANLVVACAACNISKGAKTLREWAQQK